VDAAAIAAGDLDGDGIIDLVIGHEYHEGVDGEPLYVRGCAGDGAGGFDCTAIYVGEPTGGGPTITAVELADVDGDSDLDVIAANDSIENVVCRNDGEFDFTCSPIEPEWARTHDLGIGDFDGDGAIDVLIVNNVTPNRMCLNDGTGAFECRDDGTTDNRNPSQTVGVTDLDGDGDLDIMLGVGDVGGVVSDDALDQICLGDGSGWFECSFFENIQEYPVAIVPIPEGLLTVGWHPVLCVGEGANLSCHRMDDPDRPLMTDDRFFEVPMWFMDIAVLE
jgi:hypothetical protein